MTDRAAISSAQSFAVLRWLATPLVIVMLLTAAIAAASLARGQAVRRVLRATAPAQIPFLLSHFGNDLLPMAKAYARKIAEPSTDLYATFFDDRVKFQYPPSALLFYDLFPRAIRPLDGTINPALRAAMARLSHVAVLVTAVVSIVIFEIALRRRAPEQSRGSGFVAARAALALLLAGFFYPLLFSHFIGQIQVFLNAAVTVAALLYLLGQRSLAGVCIGLCCLVKPQYGLMALWSMLRRQRGFTAGLLGAFAVGAAVSLARFGLADHLQYLHVLRELSLGEAYWLNQSVNGLVNRLLENGSALQFNYVSFAPYHPVVQTLTLVSSAVIIGLALWSRGGGWRAPGDALDLTIILAASTMASPIAWNHHYGVFLPVLAVALPGLFSRRPLGAATGPLLAAGYVALAMSLAEWQRQVFANRWVGIVGSHVFFGAVIVYVLLLALRAAETKRTPA